MTISLIAISIAMITAWAFGIFCDRMFIKWMNGLKKPSGNDAAGVTKYSCDTCKHKHMTWYDEPCDECTGDKWEKAE